MILKNSRNRTAISIFQTLKASFNYYLYKNNRKSKHYDFKLQGNTIWVFINSHEKIVFTILVGDKIEVTSITADPCLVTEFISFLHSELHLKREVLM